ncbi:MAG: serine hydrolase [Bacillota bacterium]|nr:serine hydrolase [Bacillota bacterium]
MPTAKIEDLLNKSAKKAKTLQFAMNLLTKGIQYSFSSTAAGQRFHSASAGKLMTATLIFMAIEQSRLTLETKAGSILDKETLDGLFVFGDSDYQDEVTIRQLLGHTSGINDYYESENFDASSFTDT